MASSSGSRTKRTSSGTARRKGRGRWLWGLWLMVMVWLGVEYARLPEVSGLAKENPGPTAMMRERERELEKAGEKVRHRQHWVELKRIAPHAVHAVLVSEDARFYQHGGVDWFELEAAVDDAVKKKELPRGASTLTQQLARNLYYGSSWSLLRKAREAIVAHRLEQALEKRRILTIYLNIAEWGDGVWGMEAAARAHFGVSASRLTVAQGAMLAAMLPAPRAWTPRKRPALLKRRAARLVGRLERTGKITAAQAASARAELGVARKAAPEVDPEQEAREEREELEDLNAIQQEPVAKAPIEPAAQESTPGTEAPGPVQVEAAAEGASESSSPVQGGEAVPALDDADAAPVPAEAPAVELAAPIEGQ